MHTHITSIGSTACVVKQPHGHFKALLLLLLRNVTRVCATASLSVSQLDVQHCKTWLLVSCTCSAAAELAAYSSCGGPRASPSCDGLSLFHPHSRTGSASICW